MFEVAELDQKLTKEEFKEQEPALRDGLLAVQQRLRKSDAPVIIVVGGVDGAGKGEVVNTLMQWFDPRGIAVHATDDPTDEERERPLYWRFWRRLPRRGQISMFLGSWYTQPILDRVAKKISGRDLDRHIQDILSFERVLADDGVILIKLWMHLSRDDQKQRLKTLAKNPATAWRVTRRDWNHAKLYGRFSRICADVLRKTGTNPWHLIGARDTRFQQVAVARIVRETIDRALTEREHGRAAPKVQVPPRPVEEKGVLSDLDYGRKMIEKEYSHQLVALQRRLALLSRDASRRRRSAVVVFEGSDAAGKGGTIRRITAAIDARDYHVISVAAPTDEERAHPYLWRFWNRLPRSGRITIFDRSWYGRVLVEPAEGLVTNSEWQRAYAEINDFEQDLDRHGITVVKFWLAITPEEQLQRFKAREEISYKQYKITADDWRNREKWGIYENLVHIMVERTSTPIAPWHLIPANDKPSARVDCIRILCDRLEESL